MDKATRSLNMPRLLKRFAQSHPLNKSGAQETSLKKHLTDMGKHKLSAMFLKPVETPEAISRRALLKELDQTLSDLRYARSCFENASDPEIIEACVYEIKSAEARYGYLLRKAKATGVCRAGY